MRIADIDILIVPETSALEADHWQSRWQRNMRNAQRVDPPALTSRPLLEAWTSRLSAAIAGASRPTVVVAHGLGVLPVVGLGLHRPIIEPVGAFLVAPVASLPAFSTTTDAGHPLAMPLKALPFKTKLIGSSTDPDCSVDEAQDLAQAWGADVAIIANAGHIDAQSGHGPWPEGLLTFGLFLKSLG